MSNQSLKYAVSSAILSAAWVVACTPSHDLDAASAGNAHAGAGRATSDSTASSQLGAAATGGSALQQSAAIGGRAAEGGSGHADAGSVAVGGTLANAGTTANAAGGALELGGAGYGGTSSIGGTSALTTGGSLSAAVGGSSAVTSKAGEHAGGETATTTLLSTVGTVVNTGGMATSGGTGATAGGVAPTGGTRSTSTIAADLGDLLNPPVQGYITYSTTASWDIGAVQREAFRIETPTATYFVVKSVAAITSLVDASNTPWVLYNTGYRMHRGIPNLGGCCQPNPPTAQPTMTTVLDTASVTSTHLRLVSKPVDGDYYWLVWDFYVTHVTVTVNRARAAFGFTYDGVPGNTLDGNDQLVLSTGEVESSTAYYSNDLPGPAEWAYITNGDGAKAGSLFLIQHTDDDLPESYSVPDGDGSRFTFGSGQITSTPIRFSLGLIDSTDNAAVTARVQYVIDHIPP